MQLASHIQSETILISYPVGVLGSKINDNLVDGTEELSVLENHLKAASRYVKVHKHVKYVMFAICVWSDQDKCEYFVYRL